VAEVTAAQEKRIDEALAGHCARCDSSMGVDLAKNLDRDRGDFCTLCWDRRLPVSSQVIALIVTAMEAKA
jgi:hypothetical protein